MSEIGEDSPTDRSQSGTTLIEALVVVAVTTLASLIVFPAMRQGLLTLAQRQTVSMAAARLREARADAMTRDAQVSFDIASDGRGFGVSDGRVASTPPGVTLTMLSNAPGRIMFFSDGSSSGGKIWVRAGQRSTGVSVAVAGAVAVEPG